MKTNLTLTPGKGHNLRDKLGDLVHNQDFIDYLSQMADTELYMELRPKAKLSEKQMMYSYYYKVIIQSAQQGLEDLGWELLNKQKVDHILKSQCAVGIMIKDGVEHEYLEDKSSMDKKRLHKFITDCIFFIESELQVRVPSSQSFKDKERFGREFQSVNKLNPNADF